MSLKVDHRTISQEVKQTHLKAIGLLFTAMNFYPKGNPYLSALVEQISAIGSLIFELSSLYDAEVSGAQHEILGRPYESDLDEGQWERAVGATDCQPRLDSDKLSVSNIEIMETGRCVIEIGESLEYIDRLVSEYDPQLQVHEALENVKACNMAVGLHVGLSPKPATALA